LAANIEAISRKNQITKTPTGGVRVWGFDFEILRDVVSLIATILGIAKTLIWFENWWKTKSSYHAPKHIKR
jgi:hypothetical protein